MDSRANQLHFILFPFVAPGHLIPMVDIARLLAQRGAIITIITTPVNAARVKTVLARAVSSGLQVRITELRFPYQEAGVPDGCENLDLLPSLDLTVNFINALPVLQQPAEKSLEEIKPPPSCIISDMSFPWTLDIARKFNVPRIAFHGFSCFCLLCWHNLRVSKIEDNVTSESEFFIVPGLPHKIEITKAQVPTAMLSGPLQDFGDKLVAADQASYGVIINTFEELEVGYIREFRKVKNGKVWCIGPVSLCNKDNIDKAERGNKSSIDELECLKWLDLRQPGSVLYVCLGSLCNLTASQLIELGLGLEASNIPFIWAIRGWSKSEELEKWLLEQNFDERIKERGLLIRGWAPQVLILSHPSVGSFLTHCGWNSSVEGISAGLPMITWPLFADQFCNEKLIVQVLRTGVRIGVETPLTLVKEEKIEVLVKKEDVEKAVHELMVEGEERDERRRRARELGEMAKRATEKGGSSYLNLELLMQDIMQQAYGGERYTLRCHASSCTSMIMISMFVRLVEVRLDKLPRYWKWKDRLACSTCIVLILTIGVQLYIQNGKDSEF